jgi:hypothetical protein
MHFAKLIIIAIAALTVSPAYAKNPMRDVFGRIGKTIESGNCAKDVIVDVSDSVTTLCNESKETQDHESDDVKYLKNADNTLSCSYQNGIFQVTLSNSSTDSEDGDVQISVDESGKVTEISKDQLKVEGSTCRELAAKIEKGGRMPASADSELCFDYYPSSKLNFARAAECTGSKKSSKPN